MQSIFYHDLLLCYVLLFLIYDLADCLSTAALFSTLIAVSFTFLNQESVNSHDQSQSISAVNQLFIFDFQLSILIFEFWCSIFDLFSDFLVLIFQFEIHSSIMTKIVISLIFFVTWHFQIRQSYWKQARNTKSFIKKTHWKKVLLKIIIWILIYISNLWLFFENF